MSNSLNAYIEESIKKNWERVALSDFNGVSYQFKDVARKIEKTIFWLESAGIKTGMIRLRFAGKNSFPLGCSFLCNTHIRSCSGSYPT